MKVQNEQLLIGMEKYWIIGMSITIWYIESIYLSIGLEYEHIRESSKGKES